jgi:hypothetical protein
MVIVAMLTSTEVHLNLDKAVEALSTEKVLKVGWPKNIRYPAEQEGHYVAEIAAQNEYGAPHLHIPARPFLSPAITNNKTQWLEIVRRGAIQAVHGKLDILQVLELLGSKAAGDVKKAIKAVTSPPLSPVTIEARLHKYSNKKRVGALTKPLVDTGVMLNSVTYAVETE